MYGNQPSSGQEQVLKIHDTIAIRESSDNHPECHIVHFDAFRQQRNGQSKYIHSFFTRKMNRLSFVKSFAWVKFTYTLQFEDHTDRIKQVPQFMRIDTIVVILVKLDEFGLEKVKFAFYIIQHV